MTVAVVSLELHIPYEDPAVITALLQDIEKKVTTQGGRVEKSMTPICSQALLDLGLSMSDMFRLTAIGILGEDLLEYTEEQLCEQKGVNFSITFNIRRALRKNNHFLSGDSEEAYQEEIIAHLGDVNGITYMRLRERGIATLTQLAHTFSARTLDKDVTNATSFIAATLGPGWQDRL